MSRPAVGHAERIYAGTVGAVLLASAFSAWSCQGTVAHQFGGYAYNPTLNCLEAPGVVDVIAGADPGPCPMLHCWESPCGVAYITDEACDAPPDYTDETTAKTGSCPAAIKLYNSTNHSLCPTPLDGGGGAGGGFVGCGL